MKQVDIDEFMSRSGVCFGTSGARGLVADMTDELAMLDVVVNIPEVVVPVALPVPDGLVCESYISRYLDFFGADALAGLCVAVYEHSSVGRDVLRRILEGLGAEVISLGRTDIFVPIDTEQFVSRMWCCPCWPCCAWHGNGAASCHS